MEDLTYLHKVPKKKVCHILSHLGFIIPRCRKIGGASTEGRDTSTAWHRLQHLQHAPRILHLAVEDMTLVSLYQHTSDQFCQG